MCVCVCVCMCMCVCIFTKGIITSFSDVKMVLSL